MQRFNLNYYWYRSSLHPVTFLLLPFAYLFRTIVFLRRLLYRLRIKKTHLVSVPVIVVGNITVGGTGKTPFVIWLTQFLKNQGFKPGIVSRGVGGNMQKNPRVVLSHDAPNEVGDEALLLVRQTNCPLVIGIDRVLAAQKLLQETSCDVIVSDDGLQHYRLHRDIEIALVDGKRYLGNEYLLPSGPLRESKTRLNEVDIIVVNGKNADMCYVANHLVSVKYPRQKINLSALPKKIHAVAGIGHPEQFFALLREQEFELIEHIFPDHYLYQSDDLNFADTFPIVMTEKDAVKCKDFANEHYWYLAIDVKINDKIKEEILIRLSRKTYAAEEDFERRPCSINRFKRCS